MKSPNLPPSVVGGIAEISSGTDWATPAVSFVKAEIFVCWNDQPPAYWEELLGDAGIQVSRGRVEADGFILLVSFRDEFRARNILWGAGAPLAWRKEK